MCVYMEKRPTKETYKRGLSKRPVEFASKETCKRDLSKRLIREAHQIRYIYETRADLWALLQVV